MIKFRCPNCGQKIAVNDEGVGFVISCTNCALNIVVPPHSQPEFFSQPATVIDVPHTGGALELLRPEPRPMVSWQERAAQSDAVVRAGLIPHLARWMMDKLVQTLFTQRAQLLNTQESETARIAELEKRLEKTHEKLQARMVAYERRIVELEQQLVAKEDENRQLVREKFQLAKKALESEPPPQRSRVDLRSAGFLLRA